MIYLSLHIYSFSPSVPPGKPDSIVCETTRSSDSIACTWKIEQETHLSNTYNVSVSRYSSNKLF